ncbi:MAG: hypothetical protein A2Y93_01055 [Chloroflexi bacterium RBG_13_68_17]|nr:MAG: hypothetical protein A2Y93_01055 [Chloroflexi bacterium RBG_13_68_17]
MAEGRRLSGWKGFASTAWVAVILGACAGPVDAPSAIARVAVSPSLEGAAADRLRAYTQAEGVPSFDLEPWLEEAAAEAVESGELSLIISGREPPPGWFATPLWTEGIAVVVNSDNPRRAATLSELAAMFAGTLHDWEDLQGDPGPVTVVIPFPGDSLRTRFESLVLDGARITPAAALALSATDVVAQVEADPGAIGILALSQVPESVRLVRVDGVLPSQSTVDDGRYPLSLAVLAAAPAEPDGSLRDWLSWIQGAAVP